MALFLRKHQLKYAHEYQIYVAICSNYFDAVNCHSVHIIDISHSKNFIYFAYFFLEFSGNKSHSRLRNWKLCLIKQNKIILWQWQWSSLTK